MAAVRHRRGDAQRADAGPGPALHALLTRALARLRAEQPDAADRRAAARSTPARGSWPGPARATSGSWSRSTSPTEALPLAADGELVLSSDPDRTEASAPLELGPSEALLLRTQRLKRSRRVAVARSPPAVVARHRAASRSARPHAVRRRAAAAVSRSVRAVVLATAGAVNGRDRRRLPAEAEPARGPGVDRDCRLQRAAPRAGDGQTDAAAGRRARGQRCPHGRTAAARAGPRPGAPDRPVRPAWRPPPARPGPSRGRCRRARPAHAAPRRNPPGPAGGRRGCRRASSHASASPSGDHVGSLTFPLKPVITQRSTGAASRVVEPQVVLVSDRDEPVPRARELAVREQRLHRGIAEPVDVAGARGVDPDVRRALGAVEDEHAAVGGPRRRQVAAQRAAEDARLGAGVRPACTRPTSASGRSTRRC